ncbi:MAG: hypothetical protein IT371_21570 [Deltaproteobacteria bacterium]|nr:hypothetical protein [Deltaproteobacteria bacterium]
MRIVRLLGPLLAGLIASPHAHAGDWDLNLGRLCIIEAGNNAILDCGGGYNPAFGVKQVIPDNAAFRALMSELGAIFAPNILSTAETRGWNGFNAALEMGFTSINPRKNANGGRNANDKYAPPEHRYWRAAESVSSTAFSEGNIRTGAAAARIDQELPASFAPTISAMLRKSFWLPVPSVELGLGMRHLIGSHMVAGVVSAKVSLHEGFHGWPLPGLAVRGTASRLMGTPGFNLTTGALDFSISKHFGIASTFNLTPYLGYQLLWVLAASEVIDATPGVDAVAQSLASARTPLELAQCRAADCNAHFTFDQQDNILRHRFFFGLRANLYLFSLLAEYSYFAAGRATDRLVTAVTQIPVDLADESGAQHAVSFALAVDY